MAVEPLLLEFPDELLGPRVCVRPYRPGDGAQMFEAVQESLAELRPWMVWADNHAKPEDSELTIRRIRAKWDSREDLGLGIFDRETGRFLGGSGLHRLDWNIPSGEIGYWMRTSEVGKGYVTESTRVLTDFAFGILRMRRVFIRCSSQNHRSAAVPPRVGYKHEGTHRNALLVGNGDLHDALVFGMTPQEWTSLPALRSRG